MRIRVNQLTLRLSRSGAASCQYTMQFNNKPPETIVFFSILFDPGHNALENIRNANNFGYKSIAYVNRANNSFMADMKSLDVIVLGRNENVGIGVAFSELEDYLKESSINYFIYFDQDTIVKNHAWKYIQNTYKDLFSPPDVGLLFYGSNTSSYSKLVVSSGCLFSMSIIRILGNHNSSFFVEGVDYEFCLRLKNFNYKIRNVYLESIDHLTLQDGNSLEKFGFRFNIRI